ncbi:MAG TPA: hypothetical protein PK402_09770 [Tepidisphaeraceae bacterium]|nr:hypothetical protein [Tepidisphaeraceae bacterium]
MTERKLSRSIIFYSSLSALALSGCSSVPQAPPPPLAKQNAQQASELDPRGVLEPQGATFSTPQRPTKTPPKDEAVDDITARSEQFAAMMEAWMKNQQKNPSENQLASDRSINEKVSAAMDSKSIDPTKVEPASNTALATNQPITSAQLNQLNQPNQQPTQPRVEPKTNPQPEESAVIANHTSVTIEKNEPPAPNIRMPDQQVDPFAVLDDRFTRRVQSDPRDIEAQLDLQLLRYLNQKPIPSTNELAALPNEDRELLTALLDGLANFRSTVSRSVSPLAVEKARPWLEAADRIRSRSDLSILSASLCTSVRAYGNYDPIEPLRFVASNPRPMVFYCEVDGFLSQLDKDQRWETKLSMELRLFTESGMEVWQDKTESVEDHSRRRRRDFFINKRVQFPSNLAPGLYLLKSTVQDLVANRVSETTISIELVPSTTTTK